MPNQHTHTYILAADKIKTQNLSYHFDRRKIFISKFIETIDKSSSTERTAKDSLDFQSISSNDSFEKERGIEHLLKSSKSY